MSLELVITEQDGRAEKWYNLASYRTQGGEAHEPKDYTVTTDFPGVVEIMDKETTTTHRLTSSGELVLPQGVFRIVADATGLTEAGSYSVDYRQHESGKLLQIPIDVEICDSPWVEIVEYPTALTEEGLEFTVEIPIDSCPAPFHVVGCNPVSSVLVLGGRVMRNGVLFSELSKGEYIWAAPPLILPFDDDLDDFRQTFFNSDYENATVFYWSCVGRRVVRTEQVGDDGFRMTLEIVRRCDCLSSPIWLSFNDSYKPGTSRSYTLSIGGSSRPMPVGQTNALNLTEEVAAMAIGEVATIVAEWHGLQEGDRVYTSLHLTNELPYTYSATNSFGGVYYRYIIHLE